MKPSKQNSTLMTFFADLRAAGVQQYAGAAPGAEGPVSVTLLPLPFEGTLTEEERMRAEKAAAPRPMTKVEDDPLLYAASE